MASWRTNTYIYLHHGIIFYIKYDPINIPCTGNGSGTVSSQTSSWARLVLSSPTACASFRALWVSMTTVGPWNSQKWPSAASILWRGHPGISSGLADVLALAMGRVLGGGHGCGTQLGHAMSGAE